MKETKMGYTGGLEGGKGKVSKTKETNIFLKAIGFTLLKLLLYKVTLQSGCDPGSWCILGALRL